MNGLKLRSDTIDRFFRFVAVGFQFAPSRRVLTSCQARRRLGTAEYPKPRSTFLPSAKQRAIVELSRTQNVVVSARPGAGKTATAEAIVAANPDRPVVVITYSKRLQLETAQRLDGYPDCDVFTFHGMAGRLFSSVVNNDAILYKFRSEVSKPTWTGRPYQIIILDEMQDCTDDLFWLSCTFISAVTETAKGRAPQIVALGDERQAIFGFRGADARFLSLSPTTMSSMSPYSWTHMPLSQSFRLSHQNSDFVNNVFLGGEKYITGSHDGPRPIVLHGNVYNVYSIASRLIPLIKAYGPERTAILAPSIRTNVPLSLLTNLLSDTYKIPIAVSISDEVALDDQVISGKVCVSTYHQFKGNERDLVIVYGADASYFQYIARDLPDNICPNATFVALTRARKQLVMLQDREHPPMPFVSKSKLHKYADIVNFSDDEIKDTYPVGRPIELGLLLPKNVLASQIARHVPDELLEDICKTHLHIEKVASPLPRQQHISAPDKVLTNAAKRHYEAVSDLNGLAVVAAYEYALLGTLTTLGYGSKKPLPPAGSDTHELAKWLCKEAGSYEAKVSGYKSRSLQMSDHKFDWLGDHLKAATERLTDQFEHSGLLEFEVKLQGKEFEVTEDLNKPVFVQRTNLVGRADIVQYHKTTSKQNTAITKSKRTTKRATKARKQEGSVSIWEIKFVQSLSLDHVIQVCVYAYLWASRHSNRVPRILLFNVRDGEKWEIISRDGITGLRKVVEEVMRAKYSTRGTLTTEKFLKKCEKTVEEVERVNARRDTGTDQGGMFGEEERGPPYRRREGILKY